MSETLPSSETSAETPVRRFNINKANPLTDRSAMLWIWLLGLPVSRRLAEMALSVRWDQGMTVEAGLLAAAVVLVVMSAGRLAPEKAP